MFRSQKSCQLHRRIPCAREPMHPIHQDPNFPGLWQDHPGTPLLGHWQSSQMQQAVDKCVESGLRKCWLQQWGDCGASVELVEQSEMSESTFCTSPKNREWRGMQERVKMLM